MWLLARSQTEDRSLARQPDFSEALAAGVWGPHREAHGFLEFAPSLRIPRRAIHLFSTAGPGRPDEEPDRRIGASLRRSGNAEDGKFSSGLTPMLTPRSAQRGTGSALTPPPRGHPVAAGTASTPRERERADGLFIWVFLEEQGGWFGLWPPGRRAQSKGTSPAEPTARQRASVTRTAEGPSVSGQVCRTPSLAGFRWEAGDSHPRGPAQVWERLSWARAGQGMRGQR